MVEAQISFAIAFLAGLFSFISPCILPVIPSYLSYITGLSLDQLTDTSKQPKLRGMVMANAFLFITGFTAVFVVFGASASMVGQWLYDYQGLIRKVGGVLIIIFGLYVMGMLKLPFLMTERRVQLAARPAGYAGSVFIGMAFGAAWTPCVGPILGSMMALAAASESMWSGVGLMSMYSFGLGLPLFLTALGTESFLRYSTTIRSYLGIISTLSGLFLVFVGVMIYTNAFARLTGVFTNAGIGWFIGPDAVPGNF